MGDPSTEQNVNHEAVITTKRHPLSLALERILTFVKTGQKPYQYLQLKKYCVVKRGDMCFCLATIRLPTSSPEYRSQGRRVGLRDTVHPVYTCASGLYPEHVQGEAQAEEEEEEVAGRRDSDACRLQAAGDLHLGNDEGRERDVGRQGGAI